MPPAFTVARYVLVEARRSGLPWLALGCILTALGAAAFAAQVAITETRELQAATAGAVLRVCAAFLVATNVVASVARERGDRGLEFALTLPVSRAQYYLGKLAGFATCAALVATSFAVPMLLWSELASIAAWSFSLAAEGALLAAIALFFSTTLGHEAAALGATAAYYLLGRSLSAMQAIAAGPFDGSRENPLGGAIEIVALLFPRLDQATRTEWLVYGGTTRDDWWIGPSGLGLYWMVAAAAGLFDFSRRNL